jgi:uncharacterized protein (TIGR02145 family)
MYILISRDRIIHFVISVMIFIISMSYINLYSQSSPAIKPDRLKDSLLVDREGNKYPVKIFPDHKVWMTTNLKLNIPGSYCYENEQIHCTQYGRLYTWEAAQSGCIQLGAGWRLPSMNEWQQLISYYPGIPSDSIENRKAAYKALLSGGDAQFNALLGGGRNPDGTYKRLEAHGFYWAATENDKDNTWYYNFGKGSQSLYRQNEGNKAMALSVRCVK